jgi:hypothetical protein
MRTSKSPAVSKPMLEKNVLLKRALVSAQFKNPDAFSTGSGKALALKQFTEKQSQPPGTRAVVGGQKPKIDEAIFPFPPEAKTAAQVLAKLEHVRDYWVKQPAPLNKYGVFPTVYAEMTKGLLKKSAEYRAQGFPEKSDGIESFMVPFANGFFKAFAAEQARRAGPTNTPVGTPTSISGAWQAHFAEVNNPKASIASLATSAMAAHILYDLPQVVVELHKANAPGWNIGTKQDFETAKSNFLEYGDVFASSGTPVVDALKKNFGSSALTTMAHALALVGIDDEGTNALVKTMRSTGFDTAWDLLQSEKNGNNSLTVKDLDKRITHISQLFTKHMDSLSSGSNLHRISHFPADVAGIGRALAELESLRLIS